MKISLILMCFACINAKVCSSDLHRAASPKVAAKLTKEEAQLTAEELLREREEELRSAVVVLKNPWRRVELIGVWKMRLAQGQLSQRQYDNKLKSLLSYVDFISATPIFEFMNEVKKGIEEELEEERKFVEELEKGQ